MFSVFSVVRRAFAGSVVRWVSLLAVASVVLSGSSAVAASAAPMAKADRLIVVFDRGVSDAQQEQIIEQAGASEIRQLPLIGAVLVDVGSASERVSTLHELGLRDGVRYAEPDYVLKALATPSDPMFPQLWGMIKIEAPAAWDRYAGGAVTVAVTDTGIDPSHPDLDGNLWVNSREVPGNGRDDDGNGVVDDVNGVNFSAGLNSGNPYDGDGHGTHVSGTIAAESGNGIGVAGVNPQAKILAAKFLTDSGSGSTSDAIRAIDYARSMGAKVMNASWGGGGESQALEAAIAKSGMLFVAAAGNDGADNDEDPHYPSSYELDNIVSVAATTQSDSLAYFSNYGSCSVDLAAPGYQILSTLPGGRYASLSGTSMAAPHVAGVASLLAARDPKLTPLELKARLMDSVDKPSALAGTSLTGGRLNARKALDSKATTPPNTCPPKPKPPVNTAPPTIVGSAVVGARLTASAGTWDNAPTSIEYQWYRCDGADLEDCYEVNGATESTYRSGSGDAGYYLAVEIAATNSVGTKYAHSDGIGPVAPYVEPVLSITGATLRNVKRTGKVTFTVRCNVDPCQAKLGVTIRSSKGAKVARASKSQAGGTKKVVVSVKLTAKQRKSLTKALRNRGKVNATITGYAVDGAGRHSGTVTKKIRIIG